MSSGEIEKMRGEVSNTPIMLIAIAIFFATFMIGEAILKAGEGIKNELDGEPSSIQTQASSNPKIMEGCSEIKGREGYISFECIIEEPQHKPPAK